MNNIAIFGCNELTITLEFGGQNQFYCDSESSVKNIFSERKEYNVYSKLFNWVIYFSKLQEFSYHLYQYHSKYNDLSKKTENPAQ